MKTIKSSNCVGILGTAIWLTLSLMQLNVAAAQENEVVIQEIIVTAQKREQSLHDVPMGISALSGKSLEEMGAEMFVDFARTIPGMTYNDTDRNAPGRGQNLTIRGVSTNAGGNDFTTPTVATYVDEVPIGSFFAPEPVDLERVEILRGPQGSLYGADALGGAIRFVTRKPDTAAFSSQVFSSISQTSQADDLSYRINGMLNIPISQDRAALRLVGGYQERAGWTDDDSFDPLNLVDGDTYMANDTNKLEFTHFRGNLLFQPTDRMKINLLWLAEKRLLRGAGQYDTSRPGIVQTGHFSPEPNERDTNIYSLTVEYDFDRVQLISATSYYDDESFIDLETTLLNRFILGDIPPGFPDFSGSFFRRPGRLIQNDTTTVASQEFRLVSTSDGRLTWLAGIYYSNSRSHGISPFVQEEIGEVFSFVNDGESSEYAAFGEIGLNFPGSGVNIAIGGRHFYNEFGTESSENGNTFKFSAAVDVTDNFMLYGLISEGYRVGGGNAIIPIEPPGYAPQFQPDSLTNYEIGFKSTFRNDSVILNGAVFYIDWSDVQLEVESGGFVFIDNAGKASSSGMEFELIAAISESFSILGSLTYLKAELDEDVQNFAVPLLAGDRLPGTPEWAASFSAWYDFPVGVSSMITPRLDWQYRDDSLANFDEIQGGLFNPLPRAELDAYHNLNLRCTFANTNGSWAISLFVKNVLDERPRVGVNSFNTVREFFTIQPRTTGLSATFAFK